MTETFGPYCVINQVASGSLGRVYRARHIELGRYAAVKELSPAVRHVPGQAQRLRAEAATLAGLSHPNIVTLYAYAEEPDRAWLAEQWVEGATLAALLQRHGRLTPEQALGVIVGAVAGLAHAHDQGILHRDISCTNILADLAGTSMLVDFGIAAPVTTGSTSGPDDTVVGGFGSTVVGTPAYLSPEAARGESLGKASDVYSVAAVLFHLLSGAPPFAGPAAHVVRQHAEHAAPLLRDHGSRLEALLARSLSKRPNERPRDAAAFLAELEPAAAQRYGADWRTRASIAGLVGATASTGVSAAAGGAAAPETVFVDTGLARSVAQTATGASRPVTKLSLVGGIAAAVVVAGVAAVAVTRGDDDSPAGPTAVTVEGEPGDTPSVTASSEPAPDPVVTSAPVGRWRLVSTVVRTNNPGYAKVGQVTNRRAWMVTSTCPSAQSCGGEITSSSGNKFDYTWDGSQMRVDNGGTEVEEGLCYDVETDERVPGTHYKTTLRSSAVTLRAAGKAGPRGVPTRLVGEQRTRVTVTELEGDCTNSYAETGAPSPTVVERFVVTVR